MKEQNDQQEGVKPVKERDNLDLLELVCQLHFRNLQYPSLEMHNDYWKARMELESRIKPKQEERLRSSDEIVSDIYLAYSTDSRIVFGIKEREIVKTIVEYTLNHSERPSSQPVSVKTSESMRSVKVTFPEHDKIVLTNDRGDTYTSKSEELMDFFHAHFKESPAVSVEPEGRLRSAEDWQKIYDDLWKNNGSKKYGSGNLLHDFIKEVIRYTESLPSAVSEQPEGIKSADEIYEKWMGTNMEMQYLPTPKENVIAAMKEFKNQSRPNKLMVELAISNAITDVLNGTKRPAVAQQELKELFFSHYQTPSPVSVETLIESLEEISIDHYPETVFKPISDNEWAEIVRYIQRKYSIDAISGYYGRFFHKIHRDIAKKALAKWAGQASPVSEDVLKKAEDFYNYHSGDGLPVPEIMVAYCKQQPQPSLPPVSEDEDGIKRNKIYFCGYKITVTEVAGLQSVTILKLPEDEETISDKKLIAELDNDPEMNKIMEDIINLSGTNPTGANSIENNTNE